MADVNGRYRKIHVRIWNDEKFIQMSNQGKLVFLHILTTPLSTPFGCFKAGILTLADELNIDPKSYKESLGESLRLGFLNHSEPVKVIKLKSFLKYNPPHNPNVLTSWSTAFKELPNCQLKLDTYNELKAICSKKKRGFLKSFNESFTKPALNDYRNDPLNQPRNTGTGARNRSKKLPPSKEEESIKGESFPAMYGVDADEVEGAVNATPFD